MSRKARWVKEREQQERLPFLISYSNKQQNRRFLRSLISCHTENILTAILYVFSWK